MCGLGLEAPGQAKPSQKSPGQARPKPIFRRALGWAHDFSKPGLLKVCSQPIFGMLIEIIEIELRVQFFLVFNCPFKMAFRHTLGMTSRVLKVINSGFYSREYLL